MSHQYPISSRRYQSQRDFLNGNGNNNSTLGATRQIYFDPTQTRTPQRAIQRRLTHYQPAPPQQLQQQQNPIAYPDQGAPLLHAQPPSVISSHPYGDLYEQLYVDSYEQHELAPSTVGYSSPLNIDQGMQQHVDMPNVYEYDFSGQIYLQEPETFNQRLPANFRQQECFVEQQQEPLDGYLVDESYEQVPTYYEQPAGRVTNRQFIVSQQQQQQQHPQVVAQRHFDGMSLQVARRRLSAPLQHSHQQMEGMHHMSQQQQQPQQIHQQRRQRNAAFATGDYFDPRGGRASLSDDQEHHHNDSSLLKQPVRSVILQDLGRVAPQTYYAQTNEERYDAPFAASMSSLDFTPSAQNLPLRNRQDMNMNNGSLAASAAIVTGPSSIYVPSEESLDQDPSPAEVPAGMRNPFESHPHEQRLTTPSSSMLSEPNSVITSPVTAATTATVAAVLARDPPETNEKPVAPMLSTDATMALARTHVDSREIDVLPYSQSDIGSYSDVYNSNSVSGTLAQHTRTLQHQRHSSQSRSQQPRAQQQQQPFANAKGPTISTTSNGSDQDEVASSLIEKDSLARSPITDQRLFSNPKSNPREYLDMGTSGNVRQDWLDSICGHLIEHMNSFGICVIDNFLGSIKGELILREVHRLYSNRRYSKGRLVSDKLNEDLAESEPPKCGYGPQAAADNNNSCIKQSSQSERRLQGIATDVTGNIRSDRVIWVDGCEDGCQEINNLIQTLCSVITNSSRLSLYTDNGLDKANINKRTKAHVACYPGSGTRYIKHVDNPNGDGRVITAIYYLNKNWNTKRDGGLLRMFPSGMDEVANIEPLFDRALFFWSDRRNPHEVLPAFRDRYAITVWYIGETRS